jgi:hypothetical protein
MNKENLPSSSSIPEYKIQEDGPFDSVDTGTGANPTSSTDSGISVPTNSAVGNVVSSDIKLEGLIKSQTYNYSYKGIGGNAPVVVFPTGGTFTATDKTKTVPSNVVFVGATGDYPELPYNKTALVSNDLYSTIILELNADGDISSSDAVIVRCPDCVPNLSYSFSDGSASALNIGDEGSIVLNSENFNTYTKTATKVIKTTIEGNFYDLPYTYSFTPKNIEEVSDWDAEIIPNTGLVYSKSVGDGKRQIELENVIKFSNPSSGILENHSLYEIFDLVVSGGYLTDTVTFSTSCDNCLYHEQKTPAVVLNGSRDSTVLSSDDSVDMIATATNLKENTEYCYYVETKRSTANMFIENNSGTFTTDKSHKSRDGILVDPLSLYFHVKFLPFFSGGYAANANLVNATSTDIDDDQRSIIQFHITETPLSSAQSLDNLTDGISSEDYTIDCNNCTYEPQFDTAAEMFDERPNIIHPTWSISNLKPYNQYSYTITGTGTWPVLIAQSQGVFSTSTETERTIVAHGAFCPNTGECPPGTPGLLDYEIQRSNLPDFAKFAHDSKYIDLTLTFSSMSNEYIGTHSSTQRVEFTMPNMKNYNQPKTMEVKPAINWVANSSNKSE